MIQNGMNGRLVVRRPQGWQDAREVVGKEAVHAILVQDKAGYAGGVVVMHDRGTSMGQSMPSRFGLGLSYD